MDSSGDSKPSVINDGETEIENSSEQSPTGNVNNVSVPEERPVSPSSNAGRFFTSWIFGSSASSTKSPDTPDFYIEKLFQRNVVAKFLAETLQSLRVTLSTAKLSWIKDFINVKGLEALEYVLEKYTLGIKKSIIKSSDHDDRIQLECIRCLRVLLNTGVVLKYPSLINGIVFCLHTSNNKLRTQVADVLAALCVLSLEGHKLVLDAFSDFRYIHEEKFRFQYLIETLTSNEIEEDSASLEYKTACLSLVNAIVNSPDELEERMLLREEFQRRGLKELFAIIRNSDPPDTLLTQINVYEEESHDDREDLYQRVHDFVKDADNPFSILVGLVRQVEFNVELYPRVVDTLKNLLRIVCKDLGKNSQSELWTLIELFIERIRYLTDIKKEWQLSMNEFLSSVQYIVGKYSVVSGNMDDDKVDSLKAKVDELEAKVKNLTLEKDALAKKLATKSSDKPRPVSPSIKSPTSSKGDKARRPPPPPPPPPNKTENVRQPPPPPPVFRSNTSSPLPTGDNVESISLLQNSPSKENILTSLSAFSKEVSKVEDFSSVSLPDSTLPQSPPSSPPSNASGNIPLPPLSPPPPLSSGDKIPPLPPNASGGKIPPPPPPPSVGGGKIPPPLPSSANGKIPLPPPPPPNSNGKIPLPPPPPSGNIPSPDSSPVIYKPTPIRPPPVSVNLSTTIPLKPLFWDKIPPNKKSQTVWEEIPEGEVPLNTKELVFLFSKNSTSNIKSPVSPPPRKSVFTTLLDINRANNIAIMLARIKFSYSEIKNSILELNDETLTVDNLKNLKSYAPTTDEIELVKEYTGDVGMLGNAEKYFREVMEIPRLSERLGCMIYRRKFEMEVFELKSQVEDLHQAYVELKSSMKFKYLLKTILAIGNYLNGSTFRGNAIGFRLDCLLKISETKALENNPKGLSTLLHYLAAILEEKQNDLITFMDELKHLEGASKVSYVAVIGTVASLGSGADLIKEEIRVLKKIRLTPSSDRFCEVMEEFIKQIEPTIESIKEFTQELEERLNQLLKYYGEDPTATKPEEFFGMIVEFGKSLERVRRENEEERKRIEKEHLKEMNAQSRLAIRRPSDTSSIASLLAGQDFDNTIRELRSGLRKNRDRPISKVFSELQLDVIYSHSRNASSVYPSA
ncbi:24000_t:CDS:10 [Dentiscutata erythropus]|uniref:24000_t:CDS:1 n=1 Tax=Dentiscutata erythropus TaxID=1348616 RepID=A0A9N8VQM8_9GLOM|nr:24000_t:CDS:10 [Dentiscutata erythropus]